MIFKVSRYDQSTLLQQTKVQSLPAGGVAIRIHINRIHINLHIAVTAQGLPGFVKL